MDCRRADQLADGLAHITHGRGDRTVLISDEAKGLYVRDS